MNPVKKTTLYDCEPQAGMKPIIGIKDACVGKSAEDHLEKRMLGLDGARLLTGGA